MSLEQNPMHRLRAVQWVRSTRRGTCVGAVAFLLLAVTAGGDSAATCVPKDEKLYTSNESAIKAEIEKLGAFEADMRAVLADVKRYQAEDNSNRSWGKFQGYRSVADQSSKALCAAANAGTRVVDTAAGASLYLKVYADICRAGETVSGAINDLVDCYNGNCIGVGVGAVRGAIGVKREKLDKQVEDLDGKIGRQTPVTGRESPSQKRHSEKVQESRKERVEDLKGQVRKGGLQDQTAEIAKKASKVPKQITQEDGIGLLNTGCEVVGAAGKPTLGTGGDVGKDLCVAGTSMAKSIETYGVVQDLDAASQENQTRMTKQIQQLEDKANAVYQKIEQLRAEVYAVNWGAMGKPEPNMTPIKHDDCDEEKEATPAEVQRALTQMSRPSLLGSIRSGGEPVEGSSSSFDGETMGALLKGATQALSAISADRASKAQSQTRSPSSVQGGDRGSSGGPRVSNDCGDRMRRAGRSPWECNAVAPDPK